MTDDVLKETIRMQHEKITELTHKIQMLQSRLIEANEIVSDVATIDSPESILSKMDT